MQLRALIMLGFQSEPQINEILNNLHNKQLSDGGFLCLHRLLLNARDGWRSIDAFYPFEVMRVGLQNIVEAFCALGYGNDERLKEAWNL